MSFAVSEENTQERSWLMAGLTELSKEVLVESRGVAGGGLSRAVDGSDGV